VYLQGGQLVKFRIHDTKCNTFWIRCYLYLAAAIKHEDVKTNY